MIECSYTTPNGAVATYHVIGRIEAGGDLANVMVHVYSYTSEAAFLANASLLSAQPYQVPVTGITASSLLGHLEQWLISNAGNPCSGGSIVADKSLDLQTLKDRKRAEITRDRLAADKDKFTYLGKQIKTADKDMMDLLVADARWNKGAPANWPGGWKTIDNTFVPIGTKAQWDAFFITMYDQGIVNFSTSQGLKAQLDAASTPEEIAEIRWPT